jgi:hypothetical protein
MCRAEHAGENAVIVSLSLLLEALQLGKGMLKKSLFAAEVGLLFR